MKRKTRMISIIMLSTALLVMGIVQCFAWSPQIGSRPSDLGEEITNWDYIPNGFYYILITFNERIDNDEIFKFTLYNGNTNTTEDYVKGTLSVSNTTTLTFNNLVNYGDYAMIRPLFYTINVNTPLSISVPSWSNTIYLAFGIASRENYNYYINFEKVSDNCTIGIYYMGDTGINYEYTYMQGYLSGYDIGFDNGQNIQQYTNLVGYIEQLIGQFTGDEVAQYITPIAIVLVVLFVYFLFIRFLLSLVKAKGIIKTCDIIMIVACIIMLVVMYAPMLDLTIKTEQINSSEETTEAVQINRSNIYVETTETGDIYHGPVGTAIVTKSETIEDIYKISEDIETEAIAYEKD